MNSTNNDLQFPADLWASSSYLSLVSYNPLDRTEQCRGDPGDFMETVKENLGTTEATAAILISRVEHSRFERPQIFPCRFH